MTIKEAKRAGWVRSSTLLSSDLAKAIARLDAEAHEELRADLTHADLRFFNTKTRKFSAAKTWAEL